MNPTTGKPDPDGPTPDLLYFPVPWRPVFRSVFLYTTITLYTLAGCLLGWGYIEHGFDLQAAFPAMTPTLVAVTIGGIPLVSAALAIAMAIMMRRAGITITATQLLGLDHRGFRNQIPLHAITSVKLFNQNGIRAIILRSKKHGEVYIHSKTERLAALLTFLQPFLPQYTADINQLLAFCGAPDDGLLSITPDRIVTLKTPRQLAMQQRRRGQRE